MKREGSGDSRALPNDTSLTSVPATYSKSSPSFHLSSGGALLRGLRRALGWGSLPSSPTGQ